MFYADIFTTDQCRSRGRREHLSGETAVESVQQACGNLVSALLVPVAEWAFDKEYEFFKHIRPLDSDIRGDVLLLFAVAAVTLVYFSSFDAPLRRTLADSEEE